MTLITRHMKLLFRHDSSLPSCLSFSFLTFGFSLFEFEDKCLLFVVGEDHIVCAYHYLMFF